MNNTLTSLDVGGAYRDGTNFSVSIGGRHYFCFSEHETGDDKAQCLAEVLRVNHTLKTLRLESPQ